MRLIDADALLHGIDELAQSPWFNHGKEDTGIPRVGYNERKEAVEIVRDLCIKAAPTVEEPEPVEPDGENCGGCGYTLHRINWDGPDKGLRHEWFRFCPSCGKAVKWDA